VKRSVLRPLYLHASRNIAIYFDSLALLALKACLDKNLGALALSIPATDSVASDMSLLGPLSPPRHPPRRSRRPLASCRIS
jgi:hypothetical protein